MWPGQLVENVERPLRETCEHIWATAVQSFGISRTCEMESVEAVANFLESSRENEIFGPLFLLTSKALRLVQSKLKPDVETQRLERCPQDGALVRASPSELVIVKGVLARRDDQLGVYAGWRAKDFLAHLETETEREMAEALVEYERLAGAGDDSTHPAWNDFKSTVLSAQIETRLDLDLDAENALASRDLPGLACSTVKAVPSSSFWARLYGKDEPRLRISMKNKPAWLGKDLAATSLRLWLTPSFLRLLYRATGSIATQSFVARQLARCEKEIREQEEEERTRKQRTKIRVKPEVSAKLAQDPCFVELYQEYRRRGWL